MARSDSQAGDAFRNASKLDANLAESQKVKQRNAVQQDRECDAHERPLFGGAEQVGAHAKRRA
jgi:hypothetical protein